VRECKEILEPLPAVLISYKTYFWSIPLSIVATVILTPMSLDSFEELSLWFAIALIGHLSMLPFVIYGSGRIGLKEQIALVLLMGFTRGAVVALLAQLFNLDDKLPFYYRAISSMIAVFYWFQVGSILIRFMFGFRSDVKKLVEESILRGESLEIATPDVNSNILLARISDLQKSIVKTLNGTPTRESLNSRAEEIDNLVRERIRPLSHSEWREGQLTWIKAGYKRVLTSTLSRKRVPIWGIVVLTLPFSLIGQFTRYGVLETLSMQTLWILIAIPVRVIATKIAPGRDGNYLQQNLLFIALSYTVIAPITFLAQINWPDTSYSAPIIFTTQIMSTTSFAILICVTAITLALHEDEKSVFRAISEKLKEKNLKAFLELGEKSRAEADYAQYLHAEVQSQLLACKLLLLKSAESDFTLFPPEVTQQILGRLSEINQPYERAPVRLPSLRISQLAASWKGLAEISYSLPPEIDEPSAPREVIAQLIEEAVVNAIRHGKATDVKIKVNLQGDHFYCEISDNGTLASSKSGSGLGTILFETFTSDWQLTRLGNRTVASFTIRKREAK